MFCLFCRCCIRFISPLLKWVQEMSKQQTTLKALVSFDYSEVLFKSHFR